MQHLFSYNYVYLNYFVRENVCMYTFGVSRMTSLTLYDINLVEKNMNLSCKTNYDNTRRQNGNSRHTNTEGSFIFFHMTLDIL